MVARVIPTFLYLMAAAVWVFWAEVHLAHFEVLYGHWYRKTYIFPVGFWALTFGYGFIRAWGAKENFLDRLPDILLLGLGTHLALLLLQFVIERTAASLNAPYFTLYCNAVAVLGFAALGYALVTRHFNISFNRQIPSPASLLDSRFALVAIFAVAFIFRGLAAYRLSGMGLQTVLTNSDDAQSYYRDALFILDGKRIVPYFSLGETLAVASLLKVTHMNIRAALLLQAFLCSFTPVISYFVARKVAGRSVALLTALGCALSQILIFNAANFTRESTGGLLIVTTLWCFFKLVEVEKPRSLWIWAVLFSALSGCLYLVDVYMQLPFLILAVFGLLRGFRMVLQKRILLFLMILVVPKVLMLGAQAKFSAEFAWLGRSLKNAKTLAIEYNPYAKKLALEKGVSLVADPVGFVPNFLKDFGGNSVLFAKKMGRDFLSYFFEAFSGAFDPVVLVRNSTLAGNVNFYLYLLGFWGFFRFLTQTLRGSGPSPARVSLILFVLTCVVPYLVLFMGMTRYRSAIQPLIIFFFAFGVAEKEPT